jgi:hypothetical protein
VREEKRRARRHNCRFRSKVYDGQIIDLSATGMRLSVDRSVELPIGWKVDVVSEELGIIFGVVQWQRPGSFGLKMELSSNTRAKVEAVWRNFMAAGQAAQGASSSISGAGMTIVHSRR